MEYESEEKGKLGKIIKGEGEEVEVGEVIGLLLEEGEGEEEVKGYKEGKKEEKAKEEPQEEIKEVNNNNKSSINTSYATTQPSNNSNSRIFISPLAKVIASQNNVNVSQVKGTGPNGRIVKKDIIDFIENNNSTNYSNELGSTNIAFNETNNSYTDLPNSSMRKTIAKRLLESKITIPHYYLNIDCIVDDLLKARASINSLARDKYKISINDFIIKAVALAMKDVPLANAYWQGETTRQFNQQDIAVAVAIPNGLITPIIRNAANKGLVSISNEMKELAQKAKDGKLKPEEYQGGGFSISNLGMYGIDSFAAIINPPQAGILAVGAVKQQAVVVNGNIQVGNVLSLVLSADHRIMDGAVGATFLSKVKNYLQNPTSMLL
ncbi:UNVERIFIED_CONTAM: hypothetical protein PYX00_011086 [Menopon gallinae]|uniref:Peripheral subunit-binding (PSBD) domain-containing protein n=1 Tax=Menopon gallinae TaxID=328185 RepID=A0AAW2H5V2_9NEOP